MTVDASRLKTIRKARKIGRPKLAKLAGLTERHVAKLEGTSGDLPEKAVERLSTALQVPSLVLTGDWPMSESDLEPAAKPSCTSGCCG